MIYTDGTHVITDQVDLEELHRFADRLGFKRHWFQDKPDRPHYDTLASSKKLRALELGAIKVSKQDIVRILQQRLTQTPIPCNDNIITSAASR